jgi:hypothetical protein
MKKTFFILATAVIVALTSCNFPAYTVATGNKGLTKQGETAYRCFLGIRLRPWDLSISTCAKNAGITKVSTVDMDIRPGLFITRYRLRITGE